MEKSFKAKRFSNIYALSYASKAVNAIENASIGVMGNLASIVKKSGPHLPN